MRAESAHRLINKLRIDGCQIFQIDLDRPVQPCELDILSQDERERADRMRFAKHRERHLAAHAALRCILSAQTGRPPDALGFEATSHGKPFLRGEPELAFNLSHSEGLGLVAVGTDGCCQSVGVDIELLRPVPDALALAHAHFLVQERERLEGIEPALRSHAFLTAWTRKEAYLKAIGTGLDEALPLTGVDAQTLCFSLGGTRRLSLHSLSLPQSVAALAVIGAPKTSHAKAEPMPEAVTP